MDIATRRADGTLRKPRIIWVVRLGDSLYVRSVNGPDAAWYRGARTACRATSRPAASTHDVAFVDADHGLTTPSTTPTGPSTAAPRRPSATSPASRRARPRSSSCPAPTTRRDRSAMASRTWLITGVSSGFGRELTEQLLDRGDRVVGTVRDTGKVTDLLERYPQTFRAEVLDVTDTAAVRDVVDRAFAELGRIDVVISNAGYGLFGAAEELTDAAGRPHHRHQPDRLDPAHPRRRCRTCAPRAAAASSRSPPTAARSPSPATRSTTPPSGGSRASPSRSPRRSRRSASA